MNPDPPRLLTTGVLARRLHVALHRIQYILATRPDIRPAALAGRTRLYNRQAEARLRYELNAMSARRAERNRPEPDATPCADGEEASRA